QRSHIATKVTPPPTTGPATVAMIGFATATLTLGTASQKRGGGSFKSAPALNTAFPAAGRIATRSSSLAAKRRHPPCSASHITPVSALRYFGRSIVVSALPSADS